MASNFKKKSSIKDTENSNFGNYKEYNGGGSPKGGIWGGQDGRVGWKQRENAGEVKQGEKRSEQPRTEDGKFSYNSLNGKETKYESRGKTVNPLLTGGKNGIYIQDVETQFKNKQGSLYNKYKDKWFQRGTELITKEGRKYRIGLANDDIWNIAKRSFDITKGEFTGESETFAESKKGARGKAEKAALAEARANKGETFVKNPAGELKQHGKVAGARPQNTGIQFQMHPSVLKRIAMKRLLSQPGGMATVTSGQANLDLNQPQAQAAKPQPVGTVGAGLKHSPAQIQAVKNSLAKVGVDISKMTDQQIDNLLSKRSGK